MIVNIDYEEAFEVLQDELYDEDSVLRCQNEECGSPRLEWYTDDDEYLVVSCEDCYWETQQRFSGTSYQ